MPKVNNIAEASSLRLQMQKRARCVPQWTAAFAALAICAAILFAYPAFAGPAPLGPVTLTQPDGTEFSARILGDERFLIVETLDGYTITHEAESNEWRFASRGAKGHLSPTALAVGKDNPKTLGLSRHARPSANVISAQISSRRKREAKPVIRRQGKSGPRSSPGAGPSSAPGGPLGAPPAWGPLANANLLVILADFTGGSHFSRIAVRQDFENCTFSEGTYPTGSAREFYSEASYGSFDMNGSVTDWIVVPNPYEYYCCGASGMLESFPYNSQGLVRDLCQQLDATVDFSQFDADNNGEVDGVVVIFEGEANGSAARFWPHAWDLENESITLDGKTINRYCLSNEQTTSGTIEAIGVFCHELGHVFGAPDLYDYTPFTAFYQDDTDDNSFPVAHWCLMARGCYNGPSIGVKPSHPCAFVKAQFFGWITPQEIAASGTYALTAFQTAPAGQRCYQIPLTADGDEYIFIANRGWNVSNFDHYTWDGNLRNSGLLVVHVDWHADAGGFGNGMIINDGPPAYSYYAAWVEDPAHPSPVTSWPFELKLDAALSVQGGCTSLGPTGTVWASAASNHDGFTPARISNVSARGASMTFDLEYVALGTLMPQGDVGYFYDEPLPVSGNATAVTCTITSGSLPGGLVIDCAACVISGTPSGPPDNSTFTVRAESNGLINFANVTITIADPVQITGLTIPANWPMGLTGFTGQVNTLGGAMPLLFELVNAMEFPPGLALDNAAGTVSGTPMATGVYTPEFIVTDAVGVQDSDFCTITIGPPSVIVPPVTGLTWSRNGTTVILNWDESPAVTFDAYLVYREVYSFANVSYLAPIAQVTPRSATQYEEVPPGDYDYYYAVAVLDNVGYVNFTVTPVGPVDVYAPLELTGLVAVPGEDNVSLSWTASVSADAAGYRAAWDNGGGWTAPLDVGNSVSATITGLDYALTYLFRVTVYDEVPNESPGVIIVSRPGDTIPPLDVADVSADVGFTSVILHWTPSPSTDVTGYLVEWGTGGALSQSADAGGALIFTIENLFPGTSYTFRVKAYDNASNASPGVMITAVTFFPLKKKKRHCGLGAIDSDPKSIAGSFLPIIAFLTMVLVLRRRRFFLDRQNTAA